MLEVTSRGSTRIQAWARLILVAHTFCRSAFGKSLCTYKGVGSDVHGGLIVYRPDSVEF
jgi:hypothetical protein